MNLSLFTSAILLLQQWSWRCPNKSSPGTPFWRWVASGLSEILQFLSWAAVPGTALVLSCTLTVWCTPCLPFWLQCGTWYYRPSPISRLEYAAVFSVLSSCDTPKPFACMAVPDKSFDHAPQSWNLTMVSPTLPWACGRVLPAFLSRSHCLGGTLDNLEFSLCTGRFPCCLPSGLTVAYILWSSLFLCIVFALASPRVALVCLSPQ